MATERRSSGERRRVDRRSPPGESIDVTRLEHENVCRQIDALLRTIQRLELEIDRQRISVESLAREVASALEQSKKSA